MRSLLKVTVVCGCLAIALCVLCSSRRPKVLTDDMLASAVGGEQAGCGNDANGNPINCFTGDPMNNVCTETAYHCLDIPCEDGVCTEDLPRVRVADEIFKLEVVCFPERGQCKIDPAPCYYSGTCSFDEDCVPVLLGNPPQVPALVCVQRDNLLTPWSFQPTVGFENGCDGLKCGLAVNPTLNSDNKSIAMAHSAGRP